MLKLALKTGEKVRFGENVLVRFDRVTENRIEIAIEAPREVQIHRENAKKERSTKTIYDRNM